MRFFLCGALLFAAPLFSQKLADPIARNGRLLWFTLSESPKVVESRLGRPALVAESGSQWVSWQYQLGEVAHEDFSHHVLFERGTGRMLSVTRNFEIERDVSALFPPGQTVVHYFPNAEAPRLALRVRTLSGGRFLTALGASGKSGQVTLMRADLMPVLYPWVNDASGTH